MPASDDKLERFYASTREEWRAWLEANHAIAPGVWLIYYKQNSRKSRVPYADAVEEALCFGWIDSRPNALDDERYMQLFSPRKSGSPWSRINKQRVERLIAEGLMAPAGLAMVEAAKRDGSWSAYDAIEALTVPADLAQALEANELAHRNFNAFGASSKKQILWWIESAKRPETRSKRIVSIVSAAAENRNPLAYRTNGGA